MKNTWRTALPSRPLRLALGSGILGPFLFIGSFLIEEATRPGYSIWRNQVSQLSLSPWGWMQIANFVVSGVLTLIGVIALARVGAAKTLGRATLIGLSIFSGGLIIAGIFVTGPALGYPPGASMRDDHSLHSTLHGLAGLAVFLSLAAACWCVARRVGGKAAFRGWGRYSLLSGILVFAFFVLSTLTSALDQAGIWTNAPTGIFQRIAILSGWSWVGLLMAKMLRLAEYPTP